MKNKILALMIGLMTTVNSLTCMAADFSDIKDTPWNGAEVYINKVADLGLMVGEKNALGQQIFRSKDQVSYCEAVQLVFNILKNTGNLLSYDVSKWTTILQSYSIPSWAYEAIAYGLDNNMISIDEVAKYVQSNGVNNYATREYIAEIFGKAIAVNNSINTSAVLSFKDSSEIAAEVVPYVELLSRLNILLGDENNNFNPSDLINRAQMAVIATKSYDCFDKVQVVEQTSATGTVIDNKSFGESYIITVTVNGVLNTFVGSRSVSVLNGTTQVDFSSINTGDVVQFEYNNAIIKSAIIVSDAIVQSTSEQLTGEIIAMTSSQLGIATSSSNQTFYEFATDVTVEVNGDTSNVYSLVEAFYDSDYISATITLNGNNEITEVIALSDNDYEDEIEGELSYISSSRLRIDDDSDYYEIEDEDDIVIEVNDGTEESTINDIDGLIDAIEGNKVIEVTVYITDDYVVEIVGDVVEATGELRSIDTDDYTITIDGDSGYSTYVCDEDVYIEVDDDSIDIYDLEELFEEEDMELVLTIEDGYVTQIIGETL